MYIVNKSAWWKHALFLLLFLWGSGGLFHQTAFAKEFNVEQYNAYIEYQQWNTTDSSGDMKLVSDIQRGTDKLITMTVDVGLNILTIIFVLAVIAVAGGLTLRNGQWIKWSTGAMIGTFIAIVGIRIAPILVLTSNLSSFTLLLNDIIKFIVTIGFYLSFFMFLIGLFLRSLDRIFEHPKYFKWGRGLLVGSIIVMVMSSIAPVVIGNI
jgi:hypothetical protein